VTDNGDGSFSIADNTSVGGGNSVYLEEGDVAKLNNSSADLTLDFNGTDFDTSVAGAELDLTIAAGVTRDTEWDTAAEINTATSDDDFATLTGSQVLTNKTLAAASNVIDADTAVALAANGADCPAGSYPLGVDASGAVVSCTDAWTEAENTAAAYMTASSTNALTNKTFNANDTGNSITNIENADISATAGIDFSKLGVLTSGNILVGSAGGVVTSVNPSGDVDVSSAGAFSVQANSVALTTDTTGNYAGGTSEAGSALTGDSATAFFSTGALESARMNWTDVDAAELKSAGFNWSSVPSATIFRSQINWDTFWTDAASGINWGSIPGSATDYVLKKTSSGINWQADLTGAGGGDEVSVDGGAVTNPNFASTGDIDFVDTANTVTANVNADSVALTTDTTGNYAAGDAEAGNVASDKVIEGSLKAVDAASDEDILTYESTTGDFEWHTEDEIISTMAQGALPNDSVVEADFKAVDAASDEECLTYETTTGDFEWQSCGSGSGGAKIIQLNPYSAKITGSYVTATITSVTTATQGAQIDAGDGNWRVLFDPTTDEAAVFYGIVPDNYTSTPVIKLMYSMVSATTGEVEWEGAVMCVSPGDSADVGTASFAAGAASVETVPGTAGHIDTLVSITPTDDSCASGDLIYVWVSTDAGDAGGNDDATGDRELVGAYVSYT
jgi:hypothetical protein